MQYPKHVTRYEDLYYGMEAPGQWTVFHKWEMPTQNAATGEIEMNEYYSPIGEKFKTKAELLGELTSFAEVRGFEKV